MEEEEEPAPIGRTRQTNGESESSTTTAEGTAAVAFPLIFFCSVPVSPVRPSQRSLVFYDMTLKHLLHVYNYNVCCYCSQVFC